MPRSIQSPTQTTLIRPAIPQDAAAVYRLRLEALVSQPQAFGADYDRTAADGEQAWVDRIGAYQAAHNGILAVAESGGRLGGMAGLVCGSWPKTRHNGSIYGVYLTPDWRGLHLAGALLAECEDWARAQGLLLLKLAVITTNTAAIRCYQRCGFSVYGVEPQALCWNNTFFDELLMAKKL